MTHGDFSAGLILRVSDFCNILYHPLALKNPSNPQTNRSKKRFDRASLINYNHIIFFKMWHIPK